MSTPHTQYDPHLHARVPAALLDTALHLAQALLDGRARDPHLLQAATALTAAIPQHLADANTPLPERLARLRQASQEAPGAPAPAQGAG